jgi:ABC-2 type transport system permease protein
MSKDPGKIRRLKALLIKEFFQIMRDPSNLLIAAVLPLILLFLYGYGVSLDLDHLKIGLVLEDTSPIARGFAESLTNSRYFQVTMAPHRRDLTDLLTAGSIRGIVVIPSYFTAFMYTPDLLAPIQVIADGSEPNTANFVQNYVQGAWNIWLQQEALAGRYTGPPPIVVEPRFWYNEELLSRNFLIPGSLASLMTMIGTLLTALVVAREWERGTMESMIATPVSIEELTIGKLIPYFCLGMFSMTLIVMAAIFIFQVPLRGSFLVLGFVSAAFLFTASGVGLLISTLARNQFVAAQASIYTGFLPAFILSGYIFEISSLPLPIRVLTYLVPARYFVTCLQTIFLVGNVWELIIPNTLIILLMGSIILLIIVKKTVKRLD